MLDSDRASSRMAMHSIPLLFAFILTASQGIARAITSFVKATPATNILLSKRGIMPVILGATMLVIGSVIIVIVLTISGQIQTQFACSTNDQACQNARSLLNIVPIIAGAVLVLTGVFMMIPQVRGR